MPAIAVHLPITLTMAAAAALIALWLGWRVAQIRHAEGVSVGDGGREPLIRRMRAHANFVENAPFVLILIAALELTGGPGQWWLWAVGVVFLLARIAHGFGMDGGGLAKGRTVGTALTMLALLVLALAALLRSYG